MADRAHVVTNKEQADPYCGSSLVPMPSSGWRYLAG